MSRVPSADINYAVSVQKAYYDMDIAIPWSVLGCDSAPADKVMRCFLEVREKGMIPEYHKLWVGR